MRQAQRAHGHADTRLADAETDPAPRALDDRAVADVLEYGAAREEEGASRPTRIRNGILVGLGLAAIALAVLGIIAGLGYL